MMGGLVAFAAGGSTSADRATDGTVVVAHIGAKVITVADLRRRLASVPTFQLRALGATTDEIRRAFLDRVVIHEALLAAGSEARGLADRIEVRQLIDGALCRALMARARQEVETDNPVTDEDLRSYYEKNAARFHAPQKMEIWRIVVDSREKADDVLAAMRQDATVTHWRDLAREKSLDQVTNMHGGRLGFVTPDGTTTQPGFRVSHEVLDAVSHAKDGELLGDPVKDGDGWAVIWRRQTTSAVDRPLETEASAIREVLTGQRTAERIRRLVESLRAEKLHAYAPEQLDTFAPSPSNDLTQTLPLGAPSHDAPGATSRIPKPAPGTLPGASR
jgi:peptidyl-prolyl cis-trans isomerase C